jgi:type IV pilus assembly protein PilM
MGGMKKDPKSTKTYFFEDKPLFGLDIGHDTLRVMQFAMGHKVPRLKGYGSIAFDADAIVDGVIVKPELVAKSAAKLFREKLIGDISTQRVALSLPASRTFTRAVQLPRMNAKDIDEAVHMEAEQYIPINADNLYMDYTPLREDDESMEVFVVAIPKAIVDSYLVLTRMLGLEAVMLDTAIGASARMFSYDKQSSIPSVLVDFGAESADLTVFNHGLVVTGTVAFGGDDITAILSKTLHISANEAIAIKSKYGLSSSVFQKQVVAAVGPSLELLIKEIRRTIRYYEQRYDKEPPIGQVVTMGGSANMPGLVDYFTQQLRLPTRTFDLTAHIELGHLHPIYQADHMSYVTAAGLAATNPAEIFT